MNELATVSRPTAITPTALGPIINMVVDGLDSAHARRAYRRALADFLDWYDGQGRPPLTKATVQDWRRELQGQGLATVINQRLSAVRKLATEAADNGVMDPDLAAGVRRVKGVKQAGRRLGSWLSEEDAQALLDAPDDSIRGLRDRAILATCWGQAYAGRRWLG